MTGDVQSVKTDHYYAVEHNTGMLSMHEEHFHDYFEIYFYMGREMTQFIEDRSFTLHHSDMALIGRRVFHRTRYAPDEKDRERILISFSRDTLRMLELPRLDDRLERLFALRKPSFQSERDRLLVEETVQRLSLACLGQDSDAARLRGRLQLCELICLLIDLHERGALCADHEELNSAEKRVAAIARYINENYTSDHNLNELAGLFFVSRFTLCHEFKRIAGVTVLEFLIRKRVQEACLLLCSSSLTVTEVAHTTGFRSINGFNEKFKRICGCTPREYRRRNQISADR